MCYFSWARRASIICLKENIAKTLVGLSHWQQSVVLSTSRDAGKNRAIWRYMAELKRVQEDAEKSMIGLQVFDDRLDFEETLNQ